MMQIQYYYGRVGTTYMRNEMPDRWTLSMSQANNNILQLQRRMQMPMTHLRYIIHSIYSPK